MLFGLTLMYLCTTLSFLVSAYLAFVFFLCISDFSVRFCHRYITYEYHIDSWLCFHTTVIIFSFFLTFKNKYLTLIWLLTYLRLFFFAFYSLLSNSIVYPLFSLYFILVDKFSLENLLESYFY